RGCGRDARGPSIAMTVLMARLSFDYNVAQFLTKWIGDPFMKTETLNLNTSRGATTAHVALPENDSAAAVILIQEWWGINDHIRDIAGRYANEGYLCLAPDLFRGKLAKDSAEAAKLMQGLAIDDGVETIRETINQAKQIFNVQKLAITGYCMGGT